MKQSIHSRADERVTGKRNRNEHVDFWRGLCVVGMVSWHILSHPAYPTWLSFPVIQGLNFVAEGFVFLAGTSVGLVNGVSAIHRSGATRYVRRTVRLLILYYVLVIALVAISWIVPGLGPQLPQLAVLQLLGAILTMQYQPYLGDVLSVFVFLFGLAPLFLLLQRRWGNGGLITVSALIFLVMQAVGSYFGRATQAAFELNEHGAFDVNTWQLLFVIGLIFGQYLLTGRYLTWVPQHFVALAGVTLACFLVASSLRLTLRLCPAWSAQLTSFLQDSRHPLTLLRIAYIAPQMLLVGLLTIRYWPRLSDMWISSALRLFGRTALLVFVSSVFLDYILKGILTQTNSGLLLGILAWCFELTVLYVLARWYFDRPPRVPREPPTVALAVQVPQVRTS